MRGDGVDYPRSHKLPVRWYREVPPSEVRTSRLTPETAPKRLSPEVRYHRSYPMTTPKVRSGKSKTTRKAS
jgi:hypothetical protein